MAFVLGSQRRVDMSRVARFDGIADGDDTADDDSRIEPGPVYQRSKHPPVEKLLEVFAGHIQPTAVQHTLADAEVLPHKMRNGNADRREVAAVLIRSDHDLVVTAQCVEGFGLDEGDLTVDVVALGVRPCPGRVAVLRYAQPGNDGAILEGLHWLRGVWSDVDVAEYASP